MYKSSENNSNTNDYNIYFHSHDIIPFTWISHHSQPVLATKLVLGHLATATPANVIACLASINPRIAPRACQDSLTFPVLVVRTVVAISKELTMGILTARFVT